MATSGATTRMVENTASPVAAPSLSARSRSRNLYSFFRFLSPAFSFQLLSASLQLKANGQ
jgi:hypothetical protein